MATFDVNAYLDGAQVENSTGVVDLKKTRQKGESEKQALASLKQQAEASDFNIQNRKMQQSLGSTNVGNQIRDSRANKADEDYMSNLGEVTTMGTENINENLASMQNWYNKLGNALVNNVTIAGTSAVQGSLGLIDGIVESIATGDLSKMYDNTVNQAMEGVREGVKEHFDSYQSKEYQDAHFLAKMGSVNFWADLIENLGFTEGMALSAGAGGALMGKVFPKVAKAIAGSKWGERVAGGLAGSIGEASTEAVGHYNEELENTRKTLTDQYNEQIKGLDAAALEKKNAELEAQVANIDDDLKRQGNWTLLANIGLLTVTNALEFGGLFAKGYDSSRKITLRTLKDGTYGAMSSGEKAARLAGKSLANNFSESFEEGAQDIIKEAAKANSNWNHFASSEFNPEKRELATGLLNSLVAGFHNIDKNDLGTDMLMGFITGAIGSPSLNGGWSGGILGEKEDLDVISKQQQELADRINARLAKDSKFGALYKGIVTHNVLEDRKTEAAKNGNKKAWEDADFDQMIADVQMFRNANLMDVYKKQIAEATGITEEEAQELINSNKEAWKDESGATMEPAQVVEKIAGRAQKLVDAIDSYGKMYDKFYSAHPDLSDDCIHGLTYLESCIKDRVARTKELTPTINYELSSSLGYIEELIAGGTQIDPSEYDLLGRSVQEITAKVAAAVQGGQKLEDVSKKLQKQLEDAFARNFSMAAEDANAEAGLVFDLMNLETDVRDMRAEQRSIINNKVWANGQEAHRAKEAIKAAAKKAEEKKTAETKGKQDAILEKIKAAKTDEEILAAYKAGGADAASLKDRMDLDDDTKAKVQKATRMITFKKQLHTAAESLIDQPKLVAGKDKYRVKKAINDFISDTKNASVENLLTAMTDGSFEEYIKNYKDMSPEGAAAANKILKAALAKAIEEGEFANEVKANKIDTSKLILTPEEQKLSAKATTIDKLDKFMNGDPNRAKFPEGRGYPTVVINGKTYDKIPKDHDPAINDFIELKSDEIGKIIAVAGTSITVQLPGGVQRAADMSEVSSICKEHVAGSPVRTAVTNPAPAPATGSTNGGTDQQKPEAKDKPTVYDDTKDGQENPNDKEGGKAGAREVVTAAVQVPFLVPGVDECAERSVFQKDGTYIGKAYTLTGEVVDGYEEISALMIRRGCTGKQITERYAKLQEQLDNGNKTCYFVKFPGDNRDDIWACFRDENGELLPLYPIRFSERDGKGIQGGAEMKAFLDKDFESTQNAENSAGDPALVSNYTSEFGDMVMLGKLNREFKEDGAIEKSTKTELHKTEHKGEAAHVANEKSLEDRKVDAAAGVMYVTKATGEIVDSNPDQIPETNQELIPGTVYIKVPNARGTYSLVATKHPEIGDNHDGASSDDQAAISIFSPFLDQMAKVFEGVTTSEAQEEKAGEAMVLLNDLCPQLGKLLALNNVQFSITIHPKNGPEIQFYRVKLDEHGYAVMSEKTGLRKPFGNVYTLPLNREKAQRDIDFLNYLGKLKVRRNVSIDPAQGLNTVQANGKTALQELTTEVDMSNPFVNDWIEIKPFTVIDGKSAVDTEKYDKKPLESVAEKVAKEREAKRAEAMKKEQKQTREALDEQYGSMVMMPLGGNEGAGKTSTAYVVATDKGVQIIKPDGTVDSQQSRNKNFQLKAGVWSAIQNSYDIVEVSAEGEKLGNSIIATNGPKGLKYINVRFTINDLDAFGKSPLAKIAQFDATKGYGYVRIASVPSGLQSIADECVAISKSIDKKTGATRSFPGAGEVTFVNLINGNVIEREEVAFISNMFSQVVPNKGDSFSGHNTDSLGVQQEVHQGYENLKQMMENEGVTIPTSLRKVDRVDPTQRLTGKRRKGKSVSLSLDDFNTTTTDTSTATAPKPKEVKIDVKDTTGADAKKAALAALADSTPGKTVNLDDLFGTQPATTLTPAPEAKPAPQPEAPMQNVGEKPKPADAPKPSTASRAAQTAAKFKRSKQNNKPKDLGTPTGESMMLREVDGSVGVWNMDEELAILDQMLPQLSREGKIDIVEGILKIAGKDAWGVTRGAHITLSSIAAPGTAYHEAFHVVFRNYLNEEERKALLEEAAKMYPGYNSKQLEEELAEGFREYVASKGKVSFGQKIKEFFKKLYALITNTPACDCLIDKYYAKIREGAYANIEFDFAPKGFETPVEGRKSEVHTKGTDYGRLMADRTKAFTAEKRSNEPLYKSRGTFAQLDPETQEYVKLRGISQEQFDSMSDILKKDILKCVM